MTKKEIITKIKNEMSSRRHSAEVECDLFIEKLKEKYPEFKSLYLNYNISNLKLIKAKHNASLPYTQDEKIFSLNLELENATEEFNTNKEKLHTYLKQINISPNKLKPNYTCKLCEDKGIVNGKMCKCLSNEINKQLSNANSSYNNLHTFSMANQSKMNENSNRIFKEMFDWCNTFPSQIININFFGSVGTGKTFLLECITSKLREKGFNVVLITAFALNEECRKYHFSLPNNLDNIFECDALIIDDLGTEPMLKNITCEYLYNIINLRQINNKATLISSNLITSEALYSEDVLNNQRITLTRRYSERTISRILNKSLAKSYVFSSIDKRSI